MKTHSIEATAEGLSAIMFDKFFDQSKTKRNPKEKFYTDKAKNIVFPVDNLWGFLTSQRDGCIKVFEGKDWMDYYRACQAFCSIISPDPMPFLDENNKPIKFDDFKKKTYIYTTSRIVGSGTRISRENISRPVLRLPWKIKINFILFQNEQISPETIEKWLRAGGFTIGFGNGRPRFGRFEITKWNVIKNGS